MKKALIIMESKLDELYPNGYKFMANIHDEVQIECRPEIAEAVGQIAVQSITDAGAALGLKCPLKGEFKIGNNWKETH
jgi:DNA polymerase I-like protein with 3'-5' exonuclease and polymerase domains